MIFDDYDKVKFKEYLDSKKPIASAVPVIKSAGLKLATNVEHDSNRLQYLASHDYRITASYGVSKNVDKHTENRYVVLTKHRDWKTQDRPFWIPIEMVEKVIEELQAAKDYYDDNR